MRLQSARDRHKLGQSVLEGIHLVQAYGAAYGAPVALAVSQPFCEPGQRQQAKRLPEITTPRWALPLLRKVTFWLVMVVSVIG